MKFLQRHTEKILIALLWFALLLKYMDHSSAAAASTLIFAMAAFYYLASGILILMDRAHVEKVMRLSYFIGFWGVSVCILGLLFRISFRDGDTELLLVGLSSCTAAMALAFYEFIGLPLGEVRTAFKLEIQPLVKRCIPWMLAAAGIWMTPYAAIYDSLGRWRDDPVYAEKLFNKLDHPGDDQAAEDLNTYTAEKIAASRRKKP